MVPAIVGCSARVAKYVAAIITPTLVADRFVQLVPAYSTGPALPDGGDIPIERSIVPVEMGVLAIGYEQDGKIYHLLPPRPPLSLDVIYLCEDEELCTFTSAGRFGYFRHILRAADLPRFSW